MAARRSKIVRLPLATIAIEPLLRSIFEAIASHGGAAHRDVVVRTILHQQAGAWAEGLDAARDQIIGAFEAYVDFARDVVAPHPYAHLPFGPDSRRWALTDSGRLLFSAAIRSSAA